MADEGTDLAYCDECGHFCEVDYLNGVPYCRAHVPLILEDEDFQMIFEKADVPCAPNNWKALMANFARYMLTGND